MLLRYIRSNVWREAQKKSEVSQEPQAPQGCQEISSQA